MKKLLLIVIASLLALVSVKALYALSLLHPPPGDPWFTYSIKLDERTLPAGIKFVKKGSQHNTDVTINGKSYGHHENFSNDAVINTSPIPIILKLAIAKQHLKDSLGQPISLLEGYQLLSYQKYYDFRKVNKDVRTHGDGTTLVNGNYALVLAVPINETFVKDFARITLNPKVHEIFNSGEDRPTFVRVPAPQNFTVNAMYNDQPVEVKGAVTYALNPDYKTYVERNGVEYKPVNDSMSGPGASKKKTIAQNTTLILIGISIVVVLYVLYRLIFKRT